MEAIKAFLITLNFSVNHITIKLIRILTTFQVLRHSKSIIHDGNIFHVFHPVLRADANHGTSTTERQREMQTWNRCIYANSNGHAHL